MSMSTSSSVQISPRTTEIPVLTCPRCRGTKPLVLKLSRTSKNPRRPFFVCENNLPGRAGEECGKFIWLDVLILVLMRRLVAMGGQNYMPGVGDREVHGDDHGAGSLELKELTMKMAKLQDCMKTLKYLVI